MKPTFDPSNIRTFSSAPPLPNAQPRNVAQQYQVTHASNQSSTAGLRGDGLSDRDTGRVHNRRAQPPPYSPAAHTDPPPYSPSAYTGSPPPYSPSDAARFPPMYEAAPASVPETGCILSLQRSIKAACCSMIIGLAGVGGMLLTIALSPFVGLYILLSNTHCCCIASFGMMEAEILTVVILMSSAVFIAALPGIIISPVIGLSVAYQTGKWLHGDDYRPSALLKSANNCTESMLRGIYVER